MQKTAIGFKKSFSPLASLLCTLFGLLLLAFAIIFYIWLSKFFFGDSVFDACIVGGISGAFIGGGGSALVMPILNKNLPYELISVDSTTLYVSKKVIALKDIQSVSCKKNIIIIFLKNRRPIRQAYVENASSCCEAISSRLIP